MQVIAVALEKAYWLRIAELYIIIVAGVYSMECLVRATGQGHACLLRDHDGYILQPHAYVIVALWEHIPTRVANDMSANSVHMLGSRLPNENLNGGDRDFSSLLLLIVVVVLPFEYANCLLIMQLDQCLNPCMGPNSTVAQCRQHFIRI